MLRRWFGKKKKEEERPEDGLPAQDRATEESDSMPLGTDEAAEAPTEEDEKRSAWSLLKRGLEKTRRGLKSVLTFRRQLDEDMLEELEAGLYAADFGPETVNLLVHGEGGVRQAWKEKKIQQVEDVREYLKERLCEVLRRRDNQLRLSETKPTVILVAGVNGTGKTTTIAKLAKRILDEGHTVLLAAADTFRAAAVEQLTIWSERLGVDIVTGEANADPASVAYRAAQQALENQTDFLVVDTAGRLHTQKNLMRELAKIRSVLEKKIPGAPHEALLVLDATTGQNAVSQAQRFLEAIQITGIVLTKLDGTAKGGIVVTINNVLEIPVKFVGVGETVDDLERFDAESFVGALLEADK